MKIDSTEMIIWYSGVPTEDGIYILRLKDRYESITSFRTNYAIAEWLDGTWIHDDGEIELSSVEAFTRFIK